MYVLVHVSFKVTVAQLGVSYCVGLLMVKVDSADVFKEKPK
jgi:hypothetical protein